MVEPRASTAVSCENCGKRINRKADLARHMKTHAPNKEEIMHHCSHAGCEYKTLQRSNLETHMNTHTGEKPKKCSSCDFKCGDPGSLSRHRKEIHGHEPNTNSRSRSSGRIRNSTRQRNRFSPYPSSSSGSSSSTGVASPLDPSPSVDHTSLPELPRPPEFPSSGFSARARLVRNNRMAFSTHLAIKRTKSDKSLLLASNTSLTSLRGLTMTPEANMVAHPQVLEPENTDVYGGDLLAQSPPDLISNEADDEAFESPPAQFNQPQTNPFVPSSSMIQYTVDDSFVPPLPPSADSYGYRVDETFVSSVPQYVDGYNYNTAVGSPSSYPANYDYNVNNAAYAAYSYPTQATSFDGQSSHQYSFASPDMGFYPQNADQTYMYANSMGTEGFSAQGFYGY